MLDVNNLLGWQVKTPQRSEVFVTLANGYSSLYSGLFRRWTTVRKNVGSAITYRPSAADGDWFIINEPGVYAMTYIDQLNTASAQIGISVNAPFPAAAISYAATNAAVVTNAFNANSSATAAVTMFLNAGDIVRCHTDGNQSGTQTQLESFRIVKVTP